MRTLIIKLLLHLFALMPLRMMHACGDLLGNLLFYLPNRLRNNTLINLTLCFPEMDETERMRLARSSLRETGKTFTELGALWLWKPRRIKGVVRKVIGEQIHQQALAQEKGVIYLTPHMGAWELNSLYLAEHYPDKSLTCLYRPPKLTNLHDLIKNARERTGAQLVPTTATGVKAIFRSIAQQQNIGILPDQDPGQGGGLFAPFMGIDTYTISLVSRLARKTGAPVIYIYTERLPRGGGYNIHYLAAPQEIYSEDNAVSVAAVNQGVENCIRELPQQYQWNYKRFKTRPPGESRLY